MTWIGSSPNVSANITRANGAAVVNTAFAVTSDRVVPMELHTWHAYQYGSSLPLLALSCTATITATAVRDRAIAATLAPGTSLASYGT